MERHSFDAQEDVARLLRLIGCAPKRKMINNNHHDYNHNNEGKDWKLRASRIAKESRNYIRELVENMVLEPNPEKHVIALSIGDPCVYGNLRVPVEVTDSLVDVVRSTKYNGYAGSMGHEDARKSVAEYLSFDGVDVDPQDIMLCSGCSSALDHCINVVAEPSEGHNILIPRPGFPLYRTLAEGMGITIKYYDLLPHKKWTVDLNDLESQIDNKTRAIIINNPSNPCGSVYSEDHLRDILAIASKYKIPIIADEIYERMVFPGKKFTSVAALNMNVPILICGGLAKRFLVPGWRMGWIYIHDPIGAFDYGIRKGLLSISQRIIGSNTIIQGAMVKLFKRTPESFHEDLIKTLHSHAKICYGILRDVPGLKPHMPEGAMYMMLEIQRDHFPNFTSTMEFMQKLMEEESVFCLPADCFGTPYFMRILITPPVDILKEACQRMSEFCARHYT